MEVYKQELYMSYFYEFIIHNHRELSLLSSSFFVDPQRKTNLDNPPQIMKLVHVAKTVKH